jgi:hypothetical protein
MDMASALSPKNSSAVEFAAAHEKVAIGIGADVFTFLIDQFRIANRTIVPPVFFRLVLDWQCFWTIHRMFPLVWILAATQAAAIRELSSTLRIFRIAWPQDFMNPPELSSMPSGNGVN